MRVTNSCQGGQCHTVSGGSPHASMSPHLPQVSKDLVTVGKRHSLSPTLPPALSAQRH